MGLLAESLSAPVLRGIRVWLLPRESVGYPGRPWPRTPRLFFAVFDGARQVMKRCMGLPGASSRCRRPSTGWYSPRIQDRRGQSFVRELCNLFDSFGIKHRWEMHPIVLITESSMKATSSTSKRHRSRRRRTCIKPVFQEWAQSQVAFRGGEMVPCAGKKNSFRKSFRIILQAKVTYVLAALVRFNSLPSDRNISPAAPAASDVCPELTAKISIELLGDVKSGV